MILPNQAFSRGMLFLLITLLLSCSNLSCSSSGQPDYFRNGDFNGDWIFYLGDVDKGADPDLDDSGWKPVHLPHDWSIQDYNIQNSLYQGPFFRDLPGGSDVGYLRDGTAWYRKEYQTPEGLGDKRVVLDFDGVQTQMELWVNGEAIGEHVYGYTPFQFDITSALKSEREINTLAIKTLNQGENSRWFAGAGIFRPVQISILNRISIAPWGAKITSEDISEESARISLELSLENQQKESSEIECSVELLSPDGEQISLAPVSIMAKGESLSRANLSTVIENPKLWGIEYPELYRAIISLYYDDKEIDRYETGFGIRSIAYSAEEGFLLNGEEILMKGSCMHHDNGLLGAAAFRDAEYRRVRIMKENGYNAIRTSHNPPSSDFLNACDEQGMLVIDEAFDHWVKPKRPNDYTNYFKRWYGKDIQSMVLRDRNHPSVVMWSYGNEVQERADPEGIKIGKKLIAAIREVDDTRPVTQAVCGFWDNPGKEWDYSEGAFDDQDIGGYNYKYENYESDHLEYPDRLMYGSETFALFAWENWEMVKKNSYVIGDFVWTGMDYLGESGIGHIRYVEINEPESGFHQPWPWYVSWCGDIDIIGNKKPQSYYRDVVWGESRLEMMVASPVPKGKTSRISYWGWHDELYSWNWEGEEGRPMKVKVYSSYPEVRLELNGELIGSKTITPEDKYIAEFEVNYAPGELKATGVDGVKVETVSLKTAKEAGQLVLFPELEGFTAHKNSLIYIPVEARDEEGILAVNDNSELKVFVSGEGELLAAGNANPLHDGSFTDGVFKLFRGKGIIIVRSSGASGEISVEATSNNMNSASVIVQAP